MRQLLKLEYLNYINKQKEGKAIEYFNNENRIEFYYNNDKREGVVIYHFTNKNRIEFNYIDNKKEKVMMKFNI